MQSNKAKKATLKRIRAWDLSQIVAASDMLDWMYFAAERQLDIARAKLQIERGCSRHENEIEYCKCVIAGIQNARAVLSKIHKGVFNANQA